MQYEKYKVEDFLFDEFFVRWVKNPGPETEHFWKSWIEKNPDKIHTIAEARKIVNSIQPKYQYKPPEGAYSEVLEKVLKQQTSWTQLGYFKKNDRLTTLVKYAAVLIIFIGFSALITYLNIHVYSQKDTDPLWVEKVSPSGQKITFVLEDGSKIKLNAGSKLLYPESFGALERKVQLDGEAFFEISRDETKPFVVETQNFKTIVLGTSFNIKSYKGESEYSVAVASGKVKVIKNEGNGLEGRACLLEKNQMVVYNSSNNSTTILESVPEDVFAWKDNILEFNHTEFNSVIQSLERWYGVKFIIESRNKFDGGFIGRYDGVPLELVLEGLKDQYHFQFEISIDGKRVLIY